MANTKRRTAGSIGAQLRKELGYLSDPELAAALTITVETAKNRRARGDLPPSSKVGNEHFTSVDDLRAWVARRKRVNA